MKKLRLAILGFGSVAQSFSEMLIKNHQRIENEYDTDVSVVAIGTKTKGCLVNEKGINLGFVLDDVRKNGQFRDQYGKTNMESLDIINNVDFDVLVELTPLNVKNGQPAISYMEAAFLAGKSVITANKGPIAWDYDRLKKLAKKENVAFYFEPTVLGGAPVFSMYDNCLPMTKVTEISGVLNTTTNYILGELEKGVSFEDALENGRKQGFLEADPTLDLEGWDSAVKITSLANVLMDAKLTPDQVLRQGIVGITGTQLRALKADGKTIKLICRATRDEFGKVVASVYPEKISLTEHEALVHGTTSVVSITTDMMRKLTLFEVDPDIYQTAYGVFSDMLRVIAGK